MMGQKSVEGEFVSLCATAERRRSVKDVVVQETLTPELSAEPDSKPHRFPPLPWGKANSPCFKVGALGASKRVVPRKVAFVSL